MGSIRDMAERFWNGEFPGETLGLIHATFEYEELHPGFHFIHGFGNVNVLETKDGLILIDTGGFTTRSLIFKTVRRISAGPIHTAIYTHGHTDHAFGMPPFLNEAADKNLPRTNIIAHKNVVPRFDRYRRTRGYNGRINARQFSFPGLLWPEQYDYPDIVYDDKLTVKVGEVVLDLYHAKGETDDHTWLWWPREKILFTGDQFGWVSPNAGNPQKVQRYPEEWAQSLRAMSALEPEMLIPGHGMPIFGAERICRALTEMAEWLESLVQQTLELMNDGRTLDEILNTVKPPRHLAERPYLHPVYDHPDFVVRNIWRLFGGWYDGLPSHLQPADHRSLAREIAHLAGGSEALLARARHLMESNLPLASHLIDWAAAAEPGSADVKSTRSEIYRRRMEQSPALMSKGIFGAVSRDET